MFFFLATFDFHILPSANPNGRLTPTRLTVSGEKTDLLKIEIAKAWIQIVNSTKALSED